MRKFPNRVKVYAVGGTHERELVPIDDQTRIAASNRTKRQICDWVIRELKDLGGGSKS